MDEDLHIDIKIDKHFIHKYLIYANKNTSTQKESSYYLFSDKRLEDPGIQQASVENYQDASVNTIFCRDLLVGIRSNNFSTLYIYSVRHRVERVNLKTLTFIAK